MEFIVSHNFFHQEIQNVFGRDYIYCGDCNLLTVAPGVAHGEEKLQVGKEEGEAMIEAIVKFRNEIKLINKDDEKNIYCTSFWKLWLRSTATATKNFYTDWFPRLFISPLLTECIKCVPCVDVANIISDYLPIWSPETKDNFKVSIIFSKKEDNCFILVDQIGRIGRITFKYENVVVQNKAWMIELLETFKDFSKKFSIKVYAF
jgi:hypothetical protein